MRTLIKIAIIASVLSATAAQAGTINAGFYFSQECLAKMTDKTFPSEYKFVCDQDGKCFANDMLINNMLRCAHPFSSATIHTVTVKSYYLSPKGFVQK